MTRFQISRRFQGRPHSAQRPPASPGKAMLALVNALVAQRVPRGLEGQAPAIEQGRVHAKLLLGLSSLSGSTSR